MAILISALVILAGAGICIYLLVRNNRKNIERIRSFEPSPTLRPTSPSPLGTATNRSIRRKQAVKRRSRSPRPMGLVVPEGMYWDELLGDLCYLAEEGAYLAEMAAYEAEVRQWEAETRATAAYPTQGYAESLSEPAYSPPTPEPTVYPDPTPYTPPEPETTRYSYEDTSSSFESSYSSSSDSGGSWGGSDD